MPSARLRGLPDRIPSDLRVLFVGINPGLRSAETGHHFAGPSNRFWRLLHESGLVPEHLGYEDDARVQEWGYGLTNLIPRPTSGIDGLTKEDYLSGRRLLLSKIRRRRPRVVALVGVTIFRALFPEMRGKVALGLQKETLEGKCLFVLPNPSGRNATVPYRGMLAAFRKLRRYLEK
ncbi:MAG: mismatch-specific DNA-glycosylase [Planctomycetota bacterium]|nr:mismatch-specific DNA-glycosylase [Planctomycetota bacterium]